MKCVIHGERDQDGVCRLCGKGFCGECLVILGAEKYCRGCLEQKITGVDEQTDSDLKSSDITARLIEKKSRLWAFIFSVIPGVGYLYLGLMNRGLQAMVVFFGSIFVSGFIGFEEIMALVAPVVVFYSIFDTQQLVKEINAGIIPADKEFFDFKRISFSHRWVGYGLIGLGMLALIRNVPFFFPFWNYLRGTVPPLVIIGVGVAILYKNTKRDN